MIDTFPWEQPEEKAKVSPIRCGNPTPEEWEQAMEELLSEINNR